MSDPQRITYRRGRRKCGSDILISTGIGTISLLLILPYYQLKFFAKDYSIDFDKNNTH